MSLWSDNPIATRCAGALWRCSSHNGVCRRMIEDMQIRNLTPNTQRVYVAQVVRFACHFGKYVAQRLVQLDWMTGGRAIFGSGPGALASDAHTLGIDPMVQRDRQDEAIGIIRRLFNGERVTAKSDWFTAPGRGAATFALTGGHVFRGSPLRSAHPA
jgi:hypothetical protein